MVREHFTVFLLRSSMNKWFKVEDWSMFKTGGSLQMSGEI